MALTTEQFREQLIASGLLPPEDVASILSSLPSDKQPKDGEQLARELVRQKKLTKYQAEQIYSGKGRTLVLGNYVALDKLGQGGMGVVLKAEHKRLKRLVALKVMSANVVKTPDALKRFHREVEAAAKLRHVNVVATDDADEAKGTHFLVMEYVEGSDLSVLVKKKGPLSVSHAVQCIVQAARGLEFAHSQGVVHRDIKPANLLLDSKGTVKILDMGLARIEGDTGSQAELTSTGAVMGTVDYMAPEQALSTKHADARSDIYSLGISLWYLLTGKCAYDGDTLMSKLLAHRDAPIPSLCRVDPDIPASVDSVFRKMVAKQAKDRYQSMTEVIRDLEACQSGSSPEISEAAPSSYEDPSLQSFLSNLGAASSSNVPTQQVKTPAIGSKVNAASEATMINGDFGVNTDPETMTSVRAEERQKRRSRQQEATQAIAPPLHRNPRVLLGGAAAAIVLLIAVMILIQTPHGTLRVEILDPEVEVTIKGTELTLSGTVIEPISLKTGEKNLVITRGDLSFETDSFTLRKGTETRVKVELLGDKLIVNGDGKVIAEQPIQRRGITASTTGKDSVASKAPTSTGDAPPLAIAPFDAAQAKAHQEAWARHLGVPVEFTNSLGMQFKLIPPGEFLMGVDAKEVEAFAQNLTDESSRNLFLATVIASSPRHSVRITRAFYMQTHEVKNGQYLKVMKRLPEENDPANPDSPVQSNVSLTDATAFCNALSQTEGKSAAYLMQDGNPTRILKAEGYRLPTEAEWEYACRAGTTTMWFQGENGAMVANGEWLKEFQTLHVGAYAKPNPFGLVDLYAGSNEWCFDRFAPYGADAVIDPFTDPSGADGVLRGGNFFSGGGTDVVVINSFARQNGFSNKNTNRYTGFGRVVLPIEMPQSAAPSVSSPRLFMHDPAFPLWLKDVQAMPAEKQIEAVSRKLTELSPGFDGKITGYGSRSAPPKIVNGVVTEFGFDAASVTDLSPVRAFTRLQILACSGSSGRSKLSDLSPLAGMKLSLFACANTAISDLSPLRGMPLANLFCNDTQVSDLSPLAGMRLIKLLFRNAPISDVTILHDCRSLRDLDIQGAKVAAASVAALQKALPNCRILWNDPAAVKSPAASVKK
jgi:eukaryotic-like serine/threonine-protein kinase